MEHEHFEKVISEPFDQQSQDNGDGGFAAQPDDPSPDPKPTPLARIESLDAVANRLQGELSQEIELFEHNPLKWSLYAANPDDAYGRTRREVGFLRARDTGAVAFKIERWTGVAFKITDAEKDAIAKEIKEARDKTLPKNIASTLAGARIFGQSLDAALRKTNEIRRRRGRLPQKHYLFFVRARHPQPHEGDVLAILQRVETAAGDKAEYAWTWWRDGQWRRCEGVEASTPLYGLERRNKLRLMVHEGAKKAETLNRMTTSQDPDAVDWRATHPWAPDLRRFDHVAWSGGAHGAARADFDALAQIVIREGYKQVVIVADNDQPGIKAAQTIAKRLQRLPIPLDVVTFDDMFPEAFDLADAWPEHKEWWVGGRYAGPSFDDRTDSATWATQRAQGVDYDTGRPGFEVRDPFAREHYFVAEANAFVCKRRPHKLRDKTQFNAITRVFSDVDDTARLLIKRLESRTIKVCYTPALPSGLVTHDGETAINTHTPTQIKPVEGDVTPFLTFMEYLVPDPVDRRNLLRWIVTLVARPDIRMTYGVLLVSEGQGQGKGTLGEQILAPLVGLSNVSFPGETDIVESQFNPWLAHRRLAVVHEIYAGHSNKAYNKLKSVVTDQRVTVNIKYLAQYIVENWIHLFACSNSDVPLTLAKKDRRWFVPKIAQETKLLPYWVAFHRYLRSGGLEAILHWCQEQARDEEMIVQKGEQAPDSEAKKELIREAMPPAEQLAYDLGETAMARIAWAETSAREETAKRVAAGAISAAQAEEIVKNAVEAARMVVRDDYTRRWVANIQKRDESRVPRPRELRRAMAAGGMHEQPKVEAGTGKLVEPKRLADGPARFHVVANFALKGGETWNDLKAYHTLPENVRLF